MNPPHPDSEAALELATIALFEQLGYTTTNCYNEICGDGRDVPVERLYLDEAQENQLPDIPIIDAQYSFRRSLYESPIKGDRSCFISPCPGAPCTPASCSAR